MPQQAQRSEASTENTIDYAARDKWLVEKAGLPTREVLTGYVAHVVELGLQEQEDGRFESDIPEAEEAAFLEKEKADYPDSKTYFQTMTDYESGLKKRYRRWPQKPCPAIAIIVDFPDVMIPWGEQIEGASDKPLRMILGGKQWNPERRQFGCKQFPMKESKKALGEWSLHPRSALYKIIAAAGLKREGEPIVSNLAFGLVGKSLQFEVQVYIKKLDDGREFLEESCKFIGRLPRGMEPKDPVTKCVPLYFDEPSDEECVKQLKFNVKQTMKWATNYEDSVAKMIFEQTGGSPQRSAAAPPDDIEEDVPF